MRPILPALAFTFFSAAAGAQVPLRKGPWVMDPQGDQVVVLAERATPGPLTVRATPLTPGDGGAPVVAQGDPAEALHEIRLPGLRPGTRYRYEVRAADGVVGEGSFATPPTTPAPFRFVIYGDTRSEPAAHRAVVEAITRDGPDFVLHTGDLVEDGRDPGLWQEFFDIEAPLLRRAIFVPVIGNHEIVRPGSPGIANYRRYVHASAEGPSPELDYTLRYGHVRLVLANAYDDWTGEARDWLDRELARARREGPEDWVLVAMHWGPRSSGPHGDNVMLADAGVNAVLRRHRVDLVVAGHDHLYERGEHDGLRYLVSGGGGAPLYRRRGTRDGVLAYASEHHFVRVDAEPAKLVLNVVRPDGSLIERAVLTREGWEDLRRRPSPRLVPGAGQPLPEPTPRDEHLYPKAIVAGLVVAGLAWWARRHRD